jgi:two-component system chemotaxis response regulator CheB
MSYSAPPRDIVAVGASAGGVEALCKFLALLPRDLAASVLVVLHRRPDSISRLAEILRRATPLKVVCPAEGQLLERGVCYVPAPHSHVTIGPDGRIRILEDGFYRAHNIDALFCSLAVNAGPRAVGVILSGTLKDGAFGLRAIKDAGGVTLVQDPEGAEFRDMPASAILLDGSIDFIGPLSALAEKVCGLVSSANQHQRGTC